MAARCPNCTRKVRIWNNHSGFCSKRCREESRSACLNCGKVGLFKHQRLGCCSDECRFWYVTTLLGYDREFLLTPAWDKVVYHVRLPSASAEISSLQLDELEFERAPETILVVAAPPWISRGKVLAELPYGRFDNPAWQHLRLDGTLTPEEIERFRSMCYDDPLLYHKLGVHVFEKIRGQGGTSPITPSTTPQLAPGGVPLMQPVVQMTGMLPAATGASQQAPALPAQQPLLLTQVSQAGATLSAPDHFAAQIRTLFALRGYQIATANGDGDTADTLLLTKGSKRAVALFIWETGMVQPEPVHRLLDLMTTWEASHGYAVTNGHFTLQVEDLVANRPVQLIAGDELTALLNGQQAAPQSESTPAPARATKKLARRVSGNGAATTKMRSETVVLAEQKPHPALDAEAPAVLNGSASAGGEPEDLSSAVVLDTAAPPADAVEHEEAAPSGDTARGHDTQPEGSPA
jgi:hypothetical protein